MYLDYRHLNKITIKDKFLIPLNDDLLNKFQGTTFFTKLDLCTIYHRIINSEVIRNYQNNLLKTHEEGQHFFW
jgi:hypothetical protein